MEVLDELENSEEDKFNHSRGFDYFGLSILIIQAALIVLFFIFGQYAPFEEGGENDPAVYYGFMRDVSIMIFVGFGYLMTFLKRHRFTAISYTFFISVVVIQWAILVNGFFLWVHSGNANITIGFPNIIAGMFCAGAVLISFGVWIGKVTPEQFLFLALAETLVYMINSYVVELVLEVRDVGGSMVIHMFGAYFGLAAGRFLTPANTRSRAVFAGASYTSDTFSMLGTIFLWLLWPSFNAALVPQSRQFVAIFNTVFSLCAACFVTFALSRMLRKSRQFTMEDLQNATLAGGVAMGASADILLSPGAALLIGALSGALSTLGFARIGPFLQRRFNVLDTCGVHNLHGMPSVLGALASAITASQVTTSLVAELHHGEVQGAFQIACMCITLVIAIFSGALFGWLTIKLPFIRKMQGPQLFDDSEYFEIPDVFEAGVAPVLHGSGHSREKESAPLLKDDAAPKTQVIELEETKAAPAVASAATATTGIEREQTFTALGGLMDTVIGDNPKARRRKKGGARGNRQGDNPLNNYWASVYLAQTSAPAAQHNTRLDYGQNHKSSSDSLELAISPIPAAHGTRGDFSGQKSTELVE